MTETEKSELAQALAELYRVKRELRTSTVSYCRELLEQAIARLDQLMTASPP